MEGLGRALNCAAQFLTICDLKGMTVRIPNQRPVTDWRPRVFRLSSQTLILSCELAEPINFFARSHADAKVRHGEQRLDVVRRFDEDYGEGSCAVT